MKTRLALIVAILAAGFTTQVRGQAIGTFRWQLQPYCNLVTLSVRQDGGVYTLDGVDDQCAAAQQASVVGTAFLNPDGSIGMGLSTIVSPGAAPVVLHARINLATVSGTWQDSAGNSGTFQFTPGPGSGGAPRPVPPNGIRPGSITSGQLAPGAVGAAQIALGAITSAQIANGAITAAQLADGSITAAKLAPGAVQVPIVGTCPVGQYLRGVTAAGAVICEPFGVPAVSTTVDDVANGVGYYASLVLGSNGHPIVAHLEVTANALRVTRCGNPSCSAGNVSQTIDDPAESVGAYSSIALGADGLPVISHRDNTAGGLRVTKCGNATCTAGNVSTTIDTLGAQVGYFTSIEVPSDGLPVVAHYNNAAGAPRVTKCGNPFCTAGNVSTTIDDVANTVGFNISLAIGVDGLPILAYQDITAAAVRVTKCGNAACTAGNVSTTVDDPTNIVGNYTSIAIGADGLPVIAYQDQTTAGLRVTHCGNAACTAGNVSTTVDDVANGSGYYSSIAIGGDGLPVIAHTEDAVLALRVTKCGNAACTAGNVSSTVDDPPQNTGLYTSIAVGADGLPVIAHQDLTTNLRVTKCGTQSCR